MTDDKMWEAHQKLHTHTFYSYQCPITIAVFPCGLATWSMMLHSAHISLYKQLPALAHKANAGYALSIRHMIVSFHIILAHTHILTNGYVCDLLFLILQMWFFFFPSQWERCEIEEQKRERAISHEFMHYTRLIITVVLKQKALQIKP